MFEVVAATPMGLTDKNLFAYTDNNPVMRADHGGEFWHIVGGAVIGAAVGATIKIITNRITGEKWNDGLLTATLGGAASGALAATGVGLLGQVAGNAALGAITDTAEQVRSNGFTNFNTGQMLASSAISGVAGLAGGRGVGTKHLNSLGRQTLTRTSRELKRRGLKAATREAKKASTYYWKSARHVVPQLGTSFAKAAPTYGGLYFSYQMYGTYY